MNDRKVAICNKLLELQESAKFEVDYKIGANKKRAEFLRNNLASNLEIIKKLWNVSAKLSEWTGDFVFNQSVDRGAVYVELQRDENKVWGTTLTNDDEKFQYFLEKFEFYKNYE